VITLLHGAAIYIPTWLWSMGIMEVDPQVYRLVWWGLGHSSQQINVAAMVAIWYLLATLTVGGVVLNQKISRIAFVLYILFISMASAHHLLVDPGFGSAWKVWNTSYFMYMAVLASMIHGFTVPPGWRWGCGCGDSRRGSSAGCVEGPLGRPRVQLAGLLGGGVRLRGRHHRGHVRHRADQHHRPQHPPDPGHFHATVVSGTAMAFMGVTWYVIPLIFRKRIAFFPLAKIQPYLFADRDARLQSGNDLRRDLRRPPAPLGHDLFRRPLRRPVLGGHGHHHRGDGNRGD
jgi:cytochrome c oxidase subunit I